MNFDAIVCDEAHLIKSRHTHRSKAVATLAKTCRHVIMLTGTPVVNRPAEMWFPIQLIDKNLFPSWWKYGERYCGARHNGYGWDFSGSSNTLELHDKLVHNCMLRRTKAEVMPELPPKIHSVVPLEGDLKEYQSAENDMLKWLRDNAPEKIDGVLRCEALAKVELLKQIALKTKFEQACEWIDDWLETDGKLVIFAAHRETIRLLMDKYGQVAVKLEGSDDTKERQKAIDQFQNDDNTRLFIGNIKAAGIGLTLTAASNVCFIELGWTPSEHSQAEDRIHRIGQTADSCGIYYLIASGTIEENIFALLRKKTQVINAIVDGACSSDTNIFSSLLNELRASKIVENKG